MSENATSPVKGEQVLLRILWEGVLFPYMETLNISHSKDMVSCSMTIPSDTNLRMEELVGTKLHVSYATSRVLEKFGRDPGNRGVSNWPILFQGELSGDSFQAGTGYRSQSLRFVGHSRHWDQTQLYFFDPARDSNLDTIQQAAFVGNKQLQFETDGLLSKTGRLEQILREAVEAGDDGSGRFVAYLTTLRMITNEAAQSNGMFRKYNTQLKLDSRFGAYADPDATGVLTLQQLATLMGRQIGALPNFASLQQLLEIPSRALRYTWLHMGQPTLSRTKLPAVSESFGFTEESLVRQTWRVLSSFLDETRSRIKGDSTALARVSFAVTTVLGPYAFSQEYLQADARGQLAYLTEDMFVVAVQGQTRFGGSVADAVQSVINQGNFPGSPPAAQIVGKAGKEVSPGEQGAQSLQQLGARAKVDGQDKGTEPLTTEQQALIAQQAAIISSQDVLFEFVVVPRMTFSQPPRCNVLLPDNVEGWGMQRNYLSEITRLYAKVKFLPNAEEWYVAPMSGVFYYVDEAGRVDTLDDAFDNLTPRSQRSVAATLDEGEEGEEV